MQALGNPDEGITATRYPCAALSTPALADLCEYIRLQADQYVIRHWQSTETLAHEELMDAGHHALLLALQAWHAGKVRGSFHTYARVRIWRDVNLKAVRAYRIYKYGARDGLAYRAFWAWAGSE